MEKFKNLQISEEMKNYLYSYLQDLIPIFSGSLKSINENYKTSWDSYYRDEVSETYYNEYIQALKKNSNILYNTLIPVLDVELIKNRINEIIPQLTQLNEKVHQYRVERQPFNSKWVELINNKKIEEAAKLLSRKPGIFLRQLDELIIKSENKRQSELILQLFEEVANKASIKVLLSMKGDFQKRTKNLKGRAFLIQGGFKSKNMNQNDRIVNLNRGVVTETHTTIYYTTSKVKKPLDETMCQRIVRICDETLKGYFQTKSKLNRVYISPDLQKFIIPYDLRSAKKNNGKMISKGTRINIKFNDITEEYREKIIEDLERKLKKNQQKLNKYLEKKGQFEIKYINQTIGGKYRHYNNDSNDNRNAKRLKFMEKKLENLKSFVEKNEEELNNMKNYIQV